MYKSEYVIKRVVPISVASLLALYSGSIEIFTYQRFNSGISLFILGFALFFLKFLAIQLELRKMDSLTESTKWTYYLINHVFLPVSSYLLLFILSSFVSEMYMAVLFGIMFLLILFYDDVLVTTYRSSSDVLHKAHFVFDFFKIFNIYLFALLLTLSFSANGGDIFIYAGTFLVLVFFVIKLSLYKTEKISKLSFFVTVLGSLFVSTCFVLLNQFRADKYTVVALSTTALYIVTMLLLTKIAHRELKVASLFRYALAYSAIGIVALGS